MDIDRFDDEGSKTFQIKQTNLHIYGGFFQPWLHHSERSTIDYYPVRSSTDFPHGAFSTVLNGREEIYTIVSIGGDLGHPTGVIIDGFTITRGNGDTEPPLGAPGGLHVNGVFEVGATRSGATIRNCVFNGNKARFAGARYSYNADTQVINCAFRNNSAIGSEFPEGFGGAIFAAQASDISFTKCLFSKNSANNN